MNLTAKQYHQLCQGEPVELEFEGEPCVLLTRRAFECLKEAGYDASPWTAQEMNLLAAEAAELVSGDGLDHEDD